jgi:hypothetical protein
MQNNFHAKIIIPYINLAKPKSKKSNKKIKQQNENSVPEYTQSLIFEMVEKDTNIFVDFNDKTTKDTIKQNDQQQQQQNATSLPQYNETNSVFNDTGESIVVIDENYNSFNINSPTDVQKPDDTDENNWSTFNFQSPVNSEEDYDENLAPCDYYSNVARPGFVKSLTHSSFQNLPVCNKYKKSVTVPLIANKREPDNYAIPNDDSWTNEDLNQFFHDLKTNNIDKPSYSLYTIEEMSENGNSLDRKFNTLDRKCDSGLGKNKSPDEEMKSDESYSDNNVLSSENSIVNKTWTGDNEEKNCPANTLIESTANNPIANKTWSGDCDFSPKDDNVVIEVNKRISGENFEAIKKVFSKNYGQEVTRVIYNDFESSEKDVCHNESLNLAIGKSYKLMESTYEAILDGLCYFSKVLLENGTVFIPESYEKIPDHQFLSCTYSANSGVFLIKKSDVEKTFQLENNAHRMYYALKQVKKNYDCISESAINELRREKDMLFSLKHPNIVEFLGAYRTEWRIFYIMEYLACGDFITLYHHSKCSKSFECLRQAQLYTGQILMALDYLHDIQLVYFNLLPQNICIDYKGYVKLIDLGSVHRFDEDITDDDLKKYKEKIETTKKHLELKAFSSKDLI